MKTCLAILGNLALASATAAAAPADEAKIRSLLGEWAKAYAAKDAAGVMRMYAPGQELVAYDISPPLQYRGFEAYRKDYQDYFDAYAGPLVVEERDLHVATDGSVGYAFGLERVAGTLKSGDRTDGWSRFTTLFRKIHGRWYAIHDHISVPADLSTGKAALDLKP
jgi:ketosteroid isomerase-like protein